MRLAWKASALVHPIGDTLGAMRAERGLPMIGEIREGERGWMQALKCHRQPELSLETLAWTRGRNMPLPVCASE